MLYFANCGMNYRRAQVLDPLDLVLQFHTKTAPTGALRMPYLPANSGVNLKLSQQEKCAQEDQCAHIAAYQIPTTPYFVLFGVRIYTSRM